VVDYVRRFSDLSLVGQDANAVLLDPYPDLTADSDDRLATQAAIVAFVVAYVAAHAGGGSGVTWNFPSGAFSPAANNGYAVDTSGGTSTGTLDAAPTNKDYIEFSDRKRTFGTNALTIARNGKSIDGAAADYVLQSDGDGVCLLYDSANNNWIVVKRTLG
jgi:hypothetical protein